MLGPVRVKPLDNADGKAVFIFWYVPHGRRRAYYQLRRTEGLSVG